LESVRGEGERKSSQRQAKGGERWARHVPSEGARKQVVRGNVKTDTSGGWPKKRKTKEPTTLVLGEQARNKKMPLGVHALIKKENGARLARKSRRVGQHWGVNGYLGRPVAGNCKTQPTTAKNPNPGKRFTSGIPERGILRRARGGTNKSSC